MRNLANRQLRLSKLCFWSLGQLDFSNLHPQFGRKSTQQTTAFWLSKTLFWSFLLSPKMHVPYALQKKYRFAKEMFLWLNTIGLHWVTLDPHRLLCPPRKLLLLKVSKKHESYNKHLLSPDSLGRNKYIMFYGQRFNLTMRGVLKGSHVYSECWFLRTVEAGWMLLCKGWKSGEIDSYSAGDEEKHPLFTEQKQ